MRRSDYYKPTPYQNNKKRKIKEQAYCKAIDEHHMLLMQRYYEAIIGTSCNHAAFAHAWQAHRQKALERELAAKPGDADHEAAPNRPLTDAPARLPEEPPITYFWDWMNQSMQPTSCAAWEAQVNVEAARTAEMLADDTVLSQWTAQYQSSNTAHQRAPPSERVQGDPSYWRDFHAWREAYLIANMHAPMPTGPAAYKSKKTFARVPMCHEPHHPYQLAYALVTVDSFRLTLFKYTHVKSQKDLDSKRWTSQQHRDLRHATAWYDQCRKASPGISRERKSGRDEAAQFFTKKAAVHREKDMAKAAKWLLDSGVPVHRELELVEELGRSPGTVEEWESILEDNRPQDTHWFKRVVWPASRTHKVIRTDLDRKGDKYLALRYTTEFANHLATTHPLYVGQTWRTWAAANANRAVVLLHTYEQYMDARADSRDARRTDTFLRIHSDPTAPTSNMLLHRKTRKRQQDGDQAEARSKGAARARLMFVQTP
jgi:hypothetical protein